MTTRRPPVRAALNDYARTNDPFGKLGKTQVSVDVSSVIRASPSSFRVAWTERRYTDGALAATERWTAIVTVAIQTPRDAETAEEEPARRLRHRPQLVEGARLMRRTLILTALLGSASLGGCAHLHPTRDQLRRHAETAVLASDPPKPVQIVTVAAAVAAAGPAQADTGRTLGRCPNPPIRGLGSSSPTAPPACSRHAPATSTPSKSIPSRTAPSTSSTRAPGQVTDIALEPGEQLVGSGPVAAGDTVRWIIGDTESGSGATKRVHILVKPSRPDLLTNLVINTDRRTYHLEMRSSEHTYMASLSWAYAGDQLIALRQQNAAGRGGAAGCERGRSRRAQFPLWIEGDTPPWRPLPRLRRRPAGLHRIPARHQSGRDAAALGHRT